VTSVAFSPDGRQIITSGADSTIRRWDAGTGKPIGFPITGQGNWLSSVAFSSNGQLITVVADERSTVRRWPVPETWPGGLCAKLTRNISHEEWREWVSPDIEYKEVCPGLPVPPDTPTAPATGWQNADPTG
jgi:WD40 repeat protein